VCSDRNGRSVRDAILVIAASTVLALIAMHVAPYMEDVGLAETPSQPNSTEGAAAEA